MATIKANLRVKNPTDFDKINLSSESDIIEYDNTISGLTATNSQSAIDELAKPTFTEATALANITSGESQATLWGKVKKMFSFIGTTTLTTTAQTITTAINELVGINACTTGTPTYVANVTELSMVINKAGNQKNCSLALSLNQNLSVNDIIFVLPIGFRPAYGEIAVCRVAVNASYQCLYLDIGVNGHVSCPTALTAGTQIFAKLTFI